MTTLLILLVIWATDDAGTGGLGLSPVTAGIVAVTDVNPIKTVTLEISNTDNLHRDTRQRRKIFDCNEIYQMNVIQNSFTFPDTEPPEGL